MNCEQCKTSIHRWTDTGLVDRESERAIYRHMVSCSECRTRFGGLLPLLGRDAGAPTQGTSDIDVFEDAGAPDIAGRIMAAIEDRPARREVRNITWSRRGWLMAAAAVMLIAVCLPLIWMHVERIRNETVVVTFRLIAPEAATVHLVGDFSDWSTTDVIMRDPDRDGVWETRIRLNNGAAYRYNFIIDGDRWISDPASVIEVEDGFGGVSSVINL